MQYRKRRISIVVGIVLLVSGMLWLLPTIAFHFRLEPYHYHSFRTPILSTSITNANRNDDASPSDNSNTISVGTIVPNDKIDSLTSTATSPFRSRYYPRIVPIPSRKRRKEESMNENKFWLPGQRTYIRNRFLQQQQQQQPSTVTCQVEWVDSTIDTTSKYNSILTLASLWNIVGNFTMQDHQLTTENDAHTDQNRTIVKIIALPNVDVYIVDQFVSMMQWLLDRQRRPQQQQQQYLFVSYQNTAVDFMKIPTIVLTLNIPPPIQTHNSERTQIASCVPKSPTYYDHEIITKRTKSWVQRVLVDTTICPFTKSMTYSGQGLIDVNVPVGKIAYHTTGSSHSSGISIDHVHDTELLSYLTTITAVCQLQSDVLVAIHDMIQAGPTYSMKQKLDGISSILLSAPGWDEYLELWTRLVFPILEVSVQVLDLTEQIGIVCFHPYYQTPDGRSFPGFGHMHSLPRLQQWLQDHQPYEDVEVAIKSSLPDLLTMNVMRNPPMAMTTEEDRNNDNVAILSAIAAAGGAWQRRTPHATINVLRADQLAAAESKRSTPTLYSTNILRLSRIGWSQLQQALDHERNMQ